MHDLILRPMHTTLPVGKMLCLGKNYEKHAREMGGDVPTDPVVFMKPATALVRNGGTVQIPRVSSEMHHELELVVVIGQTTRDVSESEALDRVLGYAVGLDMTLRDLQSNAKKRGEPWTIAKGFDTSAPISEVVPRELVADPHALTMRLTVNGAVRQQGTTADMILGVPRIISYLSSIFTLERGDCIFTGTPEGVGQVIAGDRLYAEIEGIVALEVTVSERV
jgi:acylpyruvate hydrolase